MGCVVVIKGEKDPRAFKHMDDEAKLKELLLREEVQSQFLSKFVNKQASSALLKEVANIVRNLLQEKILQEGINAEIPKFDVLFDNQNGVLTIKWHDETPPQIETEVIGLLYEILLKNDDILIDRK